jgi:glycolate oxidase
VDAQSQALVRVIDELRRLLGPAVVRTGQSEVSLYDHDASTFHGHADVVCLPTNRDQVVSIVTTCARHGVAFVARGSGTGLAGGAVPVEGAVVIVMTKLNRILSVDPVERMAWVEPGVLNLDLSRAVAEHGLHFAPDPSSQQSCTIGGNVANNSGGPHCLAEGVTSAHILAVEVVLPDGSVVVLGGEEPEPEGYDLRGVFVGSEGMFGVATAVAVKLTPNPPAVRTLLADFDDVRQGADAVSAIIASGIVPAALEMMDALCVGAVEAFLGLGLPLDADALLRVEIDGAPNAVAHQAHLVEAVLMSHGARQVRVAADDNERALLWKARKSAFGAVARIKPNYYLHDTVVPRRKLTAVLSEVYDIARRHNLQVMNVFHAGDGNLHPILVFDRRESGVMERVHAAGHAIVTASVAAGGALSGEHGIGVEKRDLMPLMFSPDDLEAQGALRRVFDPHGLANPTKVLPTGSSCGDLGYQPEGTWI